jgi:hypothetical protein
MSEPERRERKDEIIHRIEKQTGIPNLVETLTESIGPTDLQSLLLEVYERVVQRRRPQKVLSDYVSNRFTQPSRTDPLDLNRWDGVAFSHLPAEFSPIEFSPVCPLGTVSSVAKVSQDWILTTVRNSEVVSDPTNVLAMECARRRKELTTSDPKDSTAVHLATSQRVVRAQRFTQASMLQNFRLFSLCSAGRGTGNRAFEIMAISKHLRFYLESVQDFVGPGVPLRAKITDLTNNPEYEAVFADSLESLRQEFGPSSVTLEAARPETDYYKTCRFLVYAPSTKEKEQLELAEGGDTNWTQSLINNSKERLVTSAIGSERVCDIIKNAKD